MLEKQSFFFNRYATINGVILQLALISTLLLAIPLHVSADTVYDIKGDLRSSLTEEQYQYVLRWRRRITWNVKNRRYTGVYLNGQNVGSKLVALTFDDCPDPYNTPRILKILDEHRVKASFFLIGEFVEEYPLITQAIYRDGHLVLNHSYSHQDFSKIRDDNVTDEIERTNRAIFQATGKIPKLIRPPYGSINRSVISAIKANGLISVLWSTDSMDWANDTIENIVDNVTRNVRPGEIILLHGGKGRGVTVNALPEVIKSLKNLEYSFQTVDKIIGVSAYR